MTDPSVHVPTAGVAMTAIGVALIRERESRRPDRLYDDPLAAAFVAAARTGFDPRRWARLEELADQFFEGRSLAVRVVDDSVTEAVAQGCGQIVLLGAGLDTRVFRLGLPAETVFFEVDLPELFEFKEPVLAAHDARPDCVRRVVSADLRGDWAGALAGQGFGPGVPTLWVDEGVLNYLPRNDAHAVAETITGLSAPGSRFGIGRFEVDSAAPQYRALRELVADDSAAVRPVNGLGPDSESWFAEHGWRTVFRAWNDLVAPYGRPGMGDVPGMGTVLAIRE
ncbi:SAM-dependent methyltransferase [Nocardia sp. NPDC024068]|uniref:SAM-dependent methyltransferase n=1 Tax=Nocardia sp. NPDC024068 TaxID=3157197 RepID=UPI003400ED9F